MFGPIGGIVPGLFPVGVGQVLLADRKARLSWRRWWKIRHAGVVVEVGDASYADGSDPATLPRLVQAMPRGAEEISMRPDRHWTDAYVYIRPAWADPAVGNHPDFGYAVAHAARRYVGTPYNFLTYGKLAAHHFHIPVPHLEKLIKSRKDMMCSQLMDQSLADAGYHVFNDGRLPQDVVPAELFRALIELPGKFTIPGMATWQDNATWMVRGKPRY